MKKIAVIIFLGILMFNLGGYRLVSYVMESRHAQIVTQKIDDLQFDESELIEIRVPVSLPYQTDWQSFQKKKGSIIVNGIHYNYVMCKLTGGEMIYKCLPDMGKTELVNARENFFKLANDLQTDKAKKTTNSSISKTFNFEYFTELQEYAYSRSFNARSSTLGGYIFFIASVTIEPIHQPPNLS